MQPVERVDDLAWIGERLRGWAVVGSTVPRGFEAYVRVFHPAEGRLDPPGTAARGGLPVDVPLTWRQVARLFGRTAHPGMQWSSITRGARLDRKRPEVSPPRIGALLRPLSRRLFALIAEVREADVPAFAGCWIGTGPFVGGVTMSFSKDGTPPEHHAIAPLELDSPLLRLPGRDYAVLTGTLTELSDGTWSDVLHADPFAPESPNLAWGADRSWFVATEIDYDSTIVGGSRALADRLLASDLEAFEVDEDTDLSIEGDAVNPLPCRTSGVLRG